MFVIIKIPLIRGRVHCFDVCMHSCRCTSVCMQQNIYALVTICIISCIVLFCLLTSLTSKSLSNGHSFSDTWWLINFSHKRSFVGHIRNQTREHLLSEYGDRGGMLFEHIDQYTWQDIPTMKIFSIKTKTVTPLIKTCLHIR